MQECKGCGLDFGLNSIYFYKDLLKQSLRLLTRQERTKFTFYRSISSRRSMNNFQINCCPLSPQTHENTKMKTLGKVRGPAFRVGQAGSLPHCESKQRKLGHCGRANVPPGPNLWGGGVLTLTSSTTFIDSEQCVADSTAQFLDFTFYTRALPP